MIVSPGSALPPGRRLTLFVAACAAIFVFGVVLAVLGTLFGFPAMRERLHIDLAQQGDIFLALFFGVLLSTLISGPLVDSVGHKVVLGASSVLVAGALAWMAEANSFASAALAGFVLGFGGGGLNTTANALVAEIYVEERAAMLAVLGTFFGFGALVIPLSAATLTGTFSIPQLLFASSTLAAACAVFCFALRFPTSRGAAGFSVLGSIKAARMPGVLLYAFVLFCQSGNESSVAGWTSTYAGAMGAAPQTATWILAAYWASLMTGRLVAARLQRTIGPPALVRFSGVGSAIGCVVLLASSTVGGMSAGAVIVGLSFAAIYPATLAMAADRYEGLAGTVFGFLFAVGLVGGMLFPWGVGHLSGALGLRAAMILPILGAGAIALAAARFSGGPRPEPGRG